MSWKVLKDNSKLVYDATNQAIDFDNVFYDYFAYNQSDIVFMQDTDLDNAVGEQSYFGSELTAWVNSLGGTTRLVKNIFFDQDTFNAYVKAAVANKIDLPEHVKAKASGSSTLGTIATDVILDVTKTVSGVVDTATQNILGFKLSTLVPYLLVIGAAIVLLVLYKRYAKE